MKVTLFKEVGYSLAKLIEDIDMGEIGLPEIQRPFVWKSTKVRDLFDSMYKGFPVGYLVFWENDLGDTHRQIGMDSKQKVARLLIVDGQQRLTSLYAVLKRRPVLRSDYTPQHIHIAFRPKDSKFDVANAAIRRDPEFIADISDLWSGEVSHNRFIKNFISRLREHREVGEEEEDSLTESIEQLYNLHSYPFTALELSPKVEEEQAAVVFVRINNQGTPLKQADFILTLMSVFWDEGRRQLEHFCQASRKPSPGEASSYNPLIKPDPDQLLRVAVGLGFRRARLRYVYSILRGKDLETEQFSEELRAKQFDVLKRAQAEVLDLQNWHEFLKTLVRAGFRSTLMISSQAAVLYSYVMFLIGEQDFHLDPYELRNVIARWFFMTSLTRRYSGSPETVMGGDLARLRSVNDEKDFIITLDQIITDTLTEDFWNITLPNALATSSSRAPSLFAHYAALNLLDAQVLFSKMKVIELLDPAIKATKSAIERHHLFPKNYLKKLGITDIRDTNQIANYALVEWSDNIGISDLSPAEYFPRYAARFSKDEIKTMCNWHAVPEGWERMNYGEFLVARRKAMAKVIRDGFQTLLRRA